MSYNEFEKYLIDKKRKTTTSGRSSSNSSKKPATTRKGYLSSTPRNSTKTASKSKNSRNNSAAAKQSRVAKRKIAKRKKIVKRARNILLTALAIGVIWSMVANSKGDNQANVNQTLTTPTTTISEVVSTSKLPETTTSTSDELTEEDLMDYKSHCYYGKFGGETYLFCPEEYIFALAEHTIDKLNAEYESSGKLSQLNNGKYIPDFISPELVAAICMTESSYRVERADGLPLGADRKVEASNRAEGILQQKPGFVTDASRYSKKFGGDGYTNDDRYNPLTAMEICVTNLNRIYRTYLCEGKLTYEALSKNGTSEKELQGALVVAYNQGEGAMSNWAKSGNLDKIIKDPSDTNKYGAPYLRMINEHLENILERYEDWEM